MLSFLPTRLPRSRSLLMQIPTRRTLGFYSPGADHEIGCLLIQFDGARRFGLPGEITPQPISVQRWALAVHIWNNPPAPLESGSIQGTQPCFSWPVSKQLTSRIMHHFLWLSKQQMDIVIICVSHLRSPWHQCPALEFIAWYECVVAFVSALLQTNLPFFICLSS